MPIPSCSSQAFMDEMRTAAPPGLGTETMRRREKPICGEKASNQAVEAGRIFVMSKGPAALLFSAQIAKPSSHEAS